jgi:hypothetical protein
MACRTCPQQFQGNAMAKKPDINTLQQPLFNPAQQGLQNKTLGGAEAILQNLMNPTSYVGPAEQLNKYFGNKARTDFLGKTVPGIAEQFTNIAPGSQRSSGFTQSLGRAGSGLEENITGNLGNLITQLRGQDIGLFSGLLSSALKPAFENISYPRKNTFGENLGQIGINAAGPLVDLAGNIGTGGWWGLVKSLGSLFGKNKGGVTPDQNQETSPAKQLNQDQLTQLLALLGQIGALGGNR